MNITFRQIRVFIAVAEQGSVKRAASLLHLSPPSVSIQLKGIERQLELLLFSREKRRLSLTPAGEHFLGHAKRLVANVQETENAMSHFKKRDHGTVTIGIVSTGEYFVPRLLARFHEDHPEIGVKIRVANTREQLIGLMERSEVDLSIMGRPPVGIAARVERIGAHPFVFVCPAHHPLLDNRPVSARALDRHQFIARETGSFTRLAMERVLAKYRSRPQICMEIVSNETIKQAVIAGMGLGFLPLHCVSAELRNGLLGVIRMAGTPVMGVLNLVHLSSRALPPAAEAFRHFMIEQAENLLHAYDSSLLSQTFKKNNARSQGNVAAETFVQPTPPVRHPARRLASQR